MIYRVEPTHSAGTVGHHRRKHGGRHTDGAPRRVASRLLVYSTRYSLDGSGMTRTRRAVMTAARERAQQSVASHGLGNRA